MVYNFSCVKSLNVQWHWSRPTWSSSLNQLNAWMLCGFYNLTVTSWSKKCWLRHFSFTYLLRRCILDIQYRKSWHFLVAEGFFFSTVMTMLYLLRFLVWSTKSSLRWLMVFPDISIFWSFAWISFCNITFSYLIACIFFLRSCRLSLSNATAC